MNLKWMVLVSKCRLDESLVLDIVANPHDVTEVHNVWLVKLEMAGLLMIYPLRPF